MFVLICVSILHVLVKKITPLTAGVAYIRVIIFY